MDNQQKSKHKKLEDALRSKNRGLEKKKIAK